MINFFSKKKAKEFALDNIERECIPYACHYDEHTLLSKNGELIQVIQVKGLSKKLNEIHKEDIREAIRKTIFDNIPDDTISVYFHTIRTRQNLDQLNYYSWTFARDTHDGWAKKNHWRDKYINELYITIIHEGEDFNKQEYIISSLTPKRMKEKYIKKLEINYVKLNKISEQIEEILSSFGGRRLSIMIDHLGAHSQILEFLHKIISLRAKRVPIPICGLDQVFCQTKIAFGGNTLEVLENNEKRYAAVFTIKEYHEAELNILDKFLRVSSEFIITQALNFVPAKEAQKDFQYFNYILNVSKEPKLKQYSGLSQIIDGNNGNPTDFAMQQTSITFIADTIEILNNSIKIAMKELRKLGIIAIREDLNIELCFWAQLPGNFAFFRRQSYIHTSKAAEFASLHNTPSGSNDSIWGHCLTIFRKENGAPHFFNFHVGNNGHTIIFGPGDSAKSLLVNFLLSEATKYEPEILYIDQNENSQVFVKAIGGKYGEISLEAKPNDGFKLNPFSLEKNDQNKIFLINWLYILLFNGKEEKKYEKDISQAIDKLFKDNNPDFTKFYELIEDKELKKKVQPWCKNGKYGHLFDNSTDDLDSGMQVNSLNVENIIDDNNTYLSTAVILYAIHKFVENLSNNPSILVVNDANSLLKNQIFSIMLQFYLEKIKSKNSIAIFLCNTDNKIEKNIIDNQNSFATKIFFPDSQTENYQKDLNLSDETIEKIKNMKLIYRHIMFKQENEEIVAELNLDGLDFSIQTLLGKQNAKEAMKQAISETGENPNRWIIPYYKKLTVEI